MARKGVIIGSVIAAIVVAAGLGALIWWLVTRGDDAPPPFETIPLEGAGFEGISHRAAFTRIPEGGDMFWWFYPTLANETRDATPRPLVLWLDGVTGLPPSLLANFGMFGPLDFNLNRRNDSWIDEFNLLFVDAPLGSGFSTVLGNAETTIDPSKTTEHLVLTLKSFFSHNGEYANTPLYIFGQGYGAQLALSLALAMKNTENAFPNLKGVALGNPIVSPALALTKLGFYLEELGYVDANGRSAIENFAETNNNLVNQGQLGNAFDNFLTLGEFVNENAGTVAVNLHHIIEKLTNTNAATRDIFGQKKYLRDVVGLDVDVDRFMNETVASALGIQDASFDLQRENILQSFRGSFMAPATDTIERILNDTDITVTIYNGNLDGVSNTPGQLEWVHNLHWSGQSEFLSSRRQTLVVNGLVEGYFQETERLTFYWMNAAGLSVPLDSPAAMRRVLQRITED